MKRNRLIVLRENSLVWLLLLYFTFAGLVLLAGWLLSWDKAIHLIEPFLADQHMAVHKAKIIKDYGTSFMVFHLGLGISGWILFLSKSRLADLGHIKVEKTAHTRFNFFIISTLMALYLFGLYNIPEIVTGLRLKVLLGSSYIDRFTAVCFLLSGVLWFFTIFFVKKDSRTQHKLSLIGYFLFLALVCILIAEIKVSWGQQLFGLETPSIKSSWKTLYELYLYNPFTPLPFYAWISSIIFSIVLFGLLLADKESRFSMVIPPKEIFIAVIIMVSCSGFNNDIFGEMASLVMLLYSSWIWNKWRLRVSRPNQKSS